MSESQGGLTPVAEHAGAPTTAQAAFLAAQHGDLRGLSAALATPESDSDPAAAAWRFALRALHSSHEPSAVVAPSLNEARALLAASPAARLIAARGCGIVARACLVAFDGAALGEWLSIQESLLAAVPTAGARCEARAAALWHDLLGRGATLDPAGCKALFDEATAQREPEALIEATMLRALAAHSAGDGGAARDLARRAARMAQAEALPQVEYLVTLAIARLRRQLGSPNLALHLLAALAPVAPAQMHGWIAWEMLLAGGLEAARGLLAGPGGRGGRFAATPAVTAAESLTELLAAVGHGDRDGFGSSAAAIEAALVDFRAPAREAEILIACLDPRAELADEEARAWATGVASEIPAGLHGVAVLGQTSEGALAHVLAVPDGHGRRVFPIALAGITADFRRLSEPAGASQGLRTEGGIATLALAGPEGLSRARFFQALYGFAFVSGRHRGVLDVLVHRMREELGDAGEIVRDEAESRLSLRLRAPLVVPDPRSALPASEYVLRALVMLGTASAQEAADRLGFSVRKVQKELQQLVLSGACASKRVGNQVTYRIRDTSFTEITPLERDLRD